MSIEDAPHSAIFKKILLLLEANTDLNSIERINLARVTALFLELKEPPDPFQLYPRYREYQDRLGLALEKNDAQELETNLLTLYSHLHGYEDPYTETERQGINEIGGYWCHAGGLVPILKARPFIRENTVSADFGAGNGLQLMLLQKLFPHALSIQIELSSKMVESGRLLQKWLSIPETKIQWHIGNIMDFPAQNMDFYYLYRPVRPEGKGQLFYEKFAHEIKKEKKEIVIFSIADCLRDYIQPEFREFYNDGHLTCFRNMPD